MLDKLQKWLRVSQEADQHLDNASAALDAHFNHMHDQVNGIERVVDRHLVRIGQREMNLYDFCEFIADSPALNGEDQ